MLNLQINHMHFVMIVNIRLNYLIFNIEFQRYFMKKKILFGLAFSLKIE